MPVEATTPDQLRSWLASYYGNTVIRICRPVELLPSHHMILIGRVEPSKVPNAGKISQLMFEKQPGTGGDSIYDSVPPRDIREFLIFVSVSTHPSELNGKLKASYGKGLKYGAMLAGDYTPKDKGTVDNKRKNDGHGEPEPAHKKSALIGAKRFTSAPTQRPPSPAELSPRAGAPSARPPASSHSSSSQSAAAPAKGSGKYVLSEEQKDFIKCAKEKNLPIEYEQVNPKNSGSASWDRYESYKVARGVSEFLRLGGKMPDLSWDYSRGSVCFPTGGPFATFQLLVDGDQARPKSRPPSSSKVREQQHSSSSAEGIRVEKKKADGVILKRKKEQKEQSQREEEDTWGVSEADKQYAASKAAEEDEDALEEEEFVKEEAQLALDDAIGTAALTGARELMDQQRFQDALAVLAPIAPGANALGVVSRARRLCALCRLHTIDPCSLRGVIRPPKGEAAAPEASSVKPCVTVANHLPSRHDHLEESGRPVRRDLAKETRSVNEARYEVKGVVTLFDARLKEMLDELVDYDPLAGGGTGGGGDASSAETNEIAVQYSFMGEVITFNLNRESALPAHASAVAAGQVRRKKGTGGVVSVVRLIESAAASEFAAASSSSSGAGASPSTSPLSATFANFVNRYSKGGASALALTAKLGEDEILHSSVASLLKLGASPGKAMDGMLYLSQKRGDLTWFMALLRALRPHLPAAAFEEVVCHARATGDTALLVAVSQGDYAVARTLLEWGAKKDQKTQHREKRTVSDIAHGNDRLVSLLQEYPGAEVKPPIKP